MELAVSSISFLQTLFWYLPRIDGCRLEMKSLSCLPPSEIWGLLFQTDRLACSQSSTYTTSSLTRSLTLVCRRTQHLLTHTRYYKQGKAEEEWCIIRLEPVIDTFRFQAFYWIHHTCGCRTILWAHLCAAHPHTCAAVFTAWEEKKQRSHLTAQRLRMVTGSLLFIRHHHWHKLPSFVMSGGAVIVKGSKRPTALFFFYPDMTVKGATCRKRPPVEDHTQQIFSSRVAASCCPVHTLLWLNRDSVLFFSFVRCDKMFPVTLCELILFI